VAGLATALAVVYVIWNVPPAWSASAGIVLTLFGSNWALLGLPRFVAPDRFVLALTVLAVVLRAPGARSLPPIRSRAVYGLMIALALYGIGSALLAHTLTSRTGIFNLLDRLGLLPMLIFVIATVAFRTRQDRRVLLGTLVGIGIYLGATVLFETLGLNALVFPRYINNPHVGIHFGRGRGPFLQAAVNGLAMYACLLAAIVALREFRSGWRRGATYLAIVLCAIGPIFTLERSIWIGVTVATIGTLASARGLRRYIIPVLSIAVVAIAVALAVIPGLQDRVTARRTDIATVQGRQALNDAAYNMIEARPLLGFGWSTFVQNSPNFFQESDSYSLRIEPHLILHNAYLANAVELGLLGGTLWLLTFLVGVGYPAFRRGPPSVRPWRLALRALFILWLFVAVASPLLGAFQGLILWLFAGVVTAADDEAEPA
jgi:O-antigen ligase